MIQGRAGWRRIGISTRPSTQEATGWPPRKALPGVPWEAAPVEIGSVVERLARGKGQSMSARSIGREAARHEFHPKRAKESRKPTSVAASLH